MHGVMRQRAAPAAPALSLGQRCAARARLAMGRSWERVARGGDGGPDKRGGTLCPRKPVCTWVWRGTATGLARASQTHGLTWLRHGRVLLHWRRTGALVASAWPAVMTTASASSRRRRGCEVWPARRASSRRCSTKSRRPERSVPASRIVPARPRHRPYARPEAVLCHATRLGCEHWARPATALPFFRQRFMPVINYEAR